MSRVLVTGANGFLGRALCETLVRSGYYVRAAVRRTERPVPEASETLSVGEIHSKTSWADALRDVEFVIHAAARAHVLHDVAASDALYEETNTAGTRCLAEAAARSGVRRFLFVSSVKVNGEESSGAAYKATDAPNPKDAYGKSKWMAEQAVQAVAGRTRMAVVVVRPPLIYGPGVRANFLRLLQWVDRQWPLPLGAVRNQRSLVSLGNLSDWMVMALKHPNAVNRIWMVSDAETLSTPELLRRVASAMDRRVRLVAVPVSVLRVIGRLAGRGGEMDRLCGSLVVDTTQTRAELNWQPPLTVEDGLLRTVEWFRSRGATHAR